jgi:hypothetical protein
MLLEKVRTGAPVVVERDGKIQHLSASELLAELNEREAQAESAAQNL